MILYIQQEIVTAGIVIVEAAEGGLALNYGPTKFPGIVLPVLLGRASAQCHVVKRVALELPIAWSTRYRVHALAHDQQAALEIGLGLLPFVLEIFEGEAEVGLVTCIEAAGPFFKRGFRPVEESTSGGKAEARVVDRKHAFCCGDTVVVGCVGRIRRISVHSSVDFVDIGWD